MPAFCLCKAGRYWYSYLKVHCLCVPDPAAPARGHSGISRYRRRTAVFRPEPPDRLPHKLPLPFSRCFSLPSRYFPTPQHRHSGFPFHFRFPDWSGLLQYLHRRRYRPLLYCFQGNAMSLPLRLPPALRLRTQSRLFFSSYASSHFSILQINFLLSQVSSIVSHFVFCFLTFSLLFF